MGLLTTLAKSYLNLNETDRHTIFKLFGSFKANKFAMWEHDDKKKDGEEDKKDEKPEKKKRGLFGRKKND